MVQLAFAWLLSKKSVSSVIAGATSSEQLETNSKASGIKLSAQDLKEINNILPEKRKVGSYDLTRRSQNTP
jgi:aryl-alcohol dehydrogenase-like predicted oxidoreductase